MNRWKRDPLLADVQTLDEVRVPLHVLRFQIVEEAASLADEHEQATARMVILRVGLEVLGEVGDPFGEDCDLHFRRTGVSLVGLVGTDQVGLAIFRKCHSVLHVRSRAESRTRCAVV